MNIEKIIFSPIVHKDRSDEILKFFRTGEASLPAGYNKPIPTYLSPYVIAVENQMLSLATYQKQTHIIPSFCSLYLSFDVLENGRAPSREPYLITKRPAPVTDGDLGFPVPTRIFSLPDTLNWINSQIEELLVPCSHEYARRSVIDLGESFEE